MSGSDEREACCRPPAAALACPVCGEQGRKVGQETLDHHLEPPSRAKFGAEAGFCPNPACEVVYFGGTATLRKDEVSQAVTQKDPGDEVFVCYCFEHSRGDLRRDLAQKGTTDIPARIKQGIKEGRCECERRNPQGACCLGNVAAEIAAIKGESHTKTS